MKTTKKQLQKALSKIELLNPEEQKKQKKFLEQKEKELGFDKFQDWLFEQAGLK